MAVYSLKEGWSRSNEEAMSAVFFRFSALSSYDCRRVSFVVHTTVVERINNPTTMLSKTKRTLQTLFASPTFLMLHAR